MAQRKLSTMAAHPGGILRTEFLEPMGITAYRLAKELRFPGIYEILREERAISADVALRLAKYFGMTPQFWMNLQTDYDLRLAAASAPLAKTSPARPHRRSVAGHRRQQVRVADDMDIDVVATRVATSSETQA
jgi:antitoxin HigA-1